MNVRNERTFEVPCTVEIEHSAESLHAHVELEGVEAGPGDVVTVHGAPTNIPFGERRTFHCRATVTRANALGRLRAKLEGYLELTELYEVGFDGRTS
ncbi:MAG: hypothetical protein Q8M26_18035 [Pseudolabrys sp.]|nr:hypothetical protein [Pseudolabrys sp.]